MKTITIQGTEEQIETFRNSLSFNINEMPQKVEIRIYVVDVHSIVNKHHSKLTDEEFMSLAEEQGNIHTLKSFQKDFNIGKYETHYVIRFINVPISVNKK